MFVDPDNDDTLRFETTGRRIYANCHLISINHEMQVGEGYDTNLDEGPELTTEEKRELADYMIELWERFKIENPMPIP
jgi:hypothetical protein